MYPSEVLSSRTYFKSEYMHVKSHNGRVVINDKDTNIGLEVA